jgi:predicted amidohydrolase
MITGSLAAAGVAATAGAADANAAEADAPVSSPKPPETIRVAACQILNGPDIKKSTDAVISWMEKAAQDNVDVVSFPEACLCGFAGGGFWKTANPDDFKLGEAKIIEASIRLNIAVVLGTAHWQGSEIYNDLLVIDKGGQVRGRYSKTFPEPWATGFKGPLPVFTVAQVRSCFIICHDVRYPELVRLPAIAGAQVCYFSSHESGLKYEDKLSAYRAMPISRATENGIFCVMANAPADPDTLAGSHGNSKIIHPNGTVIEEAGYFQQRLVTATIKIEDANRWIAKKTASENTFMRKWYCDGAKDLVKVYD